MTLPAAQYLLDYVEVVLAFILVLAGVLPAGEPSE